jgi:hypothetical protein
MTPRSISLAGLCLLCIGGPLAAQGEPTIGIREPATLLSDLPNARAAGFVGGESHFLLLPGIVGANGATIYGSDLGLIHKTKKNIGLQARVGVSNMDLGPESKTRVGGEFKVSGAIKKLSLAGKAAHTKTMDISGKTEFSAAGEVQFWNDKNNANRLSLGLTGSHVTVKPEGGASADGFLVMPGLVWKTGSTTEMRADYQLDADIAGEDNFSFALAQALNGVPGAPTLILAAAKHRTIIAKFLYIR